MADRDRFPRREFLTGLLGCAAVGALAAVTLPGLPAVIDAASIPLPGWASTDPQTARAYRIALRRGDLLAQLNCHCGCMDSPTLQHQNLRDCFMRADGALDTHASGCGMCLSEALDADRWAAAGLSSGTIGERIDETYGASGCTIDRCVE